MTKSYKGVNLNGDALMHYRTKGSRNGYSKNPKYRAVGQRATGRLVNGRYVYDNPAAQQGAKNNWQQRGNEHRAANELVRDYYNKKIGDYTAEGFSKNKNGEYNVANDIKNRWENIYERRENAEKAAKAASKKGEKNNWQEMGTKTASVHVVGNKLARGTSKGARFGSSSGVSDKDIENLNNVIVREHTKRQVAKGAKNNWQQQANATAGMTRANNNLMDRKINSVNVTGQLGIMQNLDKRQRNRLVEGKTRAYKEKKSAMGYRYSPAYSNDNNPLGYHITDPRYTTAGTTKIENAKKIAAQKEKEKSEREERLRLEAGAKAREKRQKKREREAKINKMKNAILSVFKKKK